MLKHVIDVFRVKSNAKLYYQKKYLDMQGLIIDA